jgi:hypothetical protein
MLLGMRESAGGRFRSVAPDAGSGNARGWKAWKNDGAVFPPFPPTLEIDQTDYHIPTPDYEMN